MKKPGLPGFFTSVPMDMGCMDGERGDTIGKWCK
jgi:hypothetical protein